jgi:alpha-amylase/alpha-mannosidase (GH57 family)
VPKFQLVLLIHAHQPVGNFDSVFERSYTQSYLPFIEVLSKHPAIRVGLHYSGPLLEWIERAHPEYFERLRAMVESGQVEMVGGGYYEPVLIAIPAKDRHEQIVRLADYIEKHFVKRPRGLWLTERVWEPQIPSSLAPAGVEYTLVDDNHFLGGGFETGQLHGHYIAEDMGHGVKLLPGLKTLRYLIPFREPSETIDFLRTCASEYPDGLAAMGDDLEKFGGWPGTHDLCYRDGWLDKFFRAIEQEAEWLEASTPGDAVNARPALGRADLPTASYTEMMEWALPTAARKRFHALVEEFFTRPEALPFLRGGIWRNFFTKYSEANLLQKKMLHISKLLQSLAEGRSYKASTEAGKNAATLLLRGQCNDAYWHGVFGGLYSPHLRTAVWRPLVEAEAIVEGLARPKRRYAACEKLDFDGDGNEEIYLTSDRYAALVKPDDGGTICELDCRQSNATLINSLTRRLEAYHSSVADVVDNDPLHVKTIHDQRSAKEENLERWLHYDRWPRNMFRLLLFGQGKTQQDCAPAHLEEDAGLAGGRYAVEESSETTVALRSPEGAEWSARKTLSFARTKAGFDVVCEATVRRNAPGTAAVQIGIENVVNFLAPAAEDRYFESGGKRFPLRWSAEASGDVLSVTDGWQKVTITFETSSAQKFWIAPIETVSESEEGFERIYQGSQIIAVWPVELAQDADWSGRVTMRVAATV